MTNITRRISSLAPVLLERTSKQPAVPIIVEGPKTDPLGQPSVTMLLKRHRGAVYVIAVNAADKPVRAQFDLKGFISNKAEGRVAWEKRSVRTTEAVFEDMFDIFGVHVYRFGE